MSEDSSDKPSCHYVETFDEQLALTLESILDGFFACDSDWRLVYLNSTAESVFGNPREELLGKSFWEVFPSTLGTQYEQELRSAAAGEIRDFENFYEPWGRWYHNRCFPRKGGGISSYFQDITDKKRTEKALLENEQRLNFYVDHSPLASIEWNSNFIVSRWAGEAEKIFGWTQSETIGKPIMDLHMIYEEDIPLVKGTMAKLTAGDANYNVSSNRNYTKDGRVIYCEWYNTVVTDPQGRLISVLSQVMDVTERRKLEEKLRSSEEKYRALGENISDCIWESDAQGRFTYLSPNFEKITGYPPEAFLGKSTVELFPQNPAYQSEELLATLVSGQMLQGLEYRIRHRDGGIITVELSPSPTISQDGTFMGLRGVARDITARKVAEIALAEKEEMYRSLVDNLQNAVVYQITDTLGKDRRFTYISRAVERLNETTVEEVLADAGVIYRQILPEYRQMLYEHEEEALKNSSPLHVEVQSRLPSGRLRWFEYTSTPHRQSDGQLVWDGIQVDITDRKQAEEALQDLSQRLAYHVDNSPLAVIEWGPDMRLIRWSGEAERIFGWKAEEVLGKRMEDFRWVFEGDEQLVAEVSADLQTGKYPSRFSSNRNYHKDRSVVYCEWYSSSLLDESGNLKSILSLVLDDTERKRAEKSLRTSLAEKDVLLQEVHHRVKNNLTSIISLLDLQKEWITDKAALISLQDIADRIMSMALVHERLYQNKNIGWIDFQEYLYDLTSRLLISYGVGSTISCSVDATGLEMGLDSAIPLGLVVNELVTNAIKHAFPLGKPRAGSEGCEILINAKKDEDTITLSIADNGVGLPPDLDWRSCSSLGLRLVSMLGEGQLRGQIHLDLAEGTRFIIKFTEVKT